MFANTSNTAAPSASASGSVSNFATQVLQGNTIENHYGNGIRCQGPQMSVSPFATTNLNIKRPMDYIYYTPYYNPAVDDNGNLTNPGNAFQFTEVYTPPGLESVIDVTRTIESQSVTDTTTIFSQ